MNLNKGKQERKYHTFLEDKYRIDSLPCGIAIPFNIELEKLRKRALEIVFKLDPKTPSSKLFATLEMYYESNPEEAQEQILQMIKTISVLTEFITDGKITEKYIQKNATEEEISDFLKAIQEAQEEKTRKKLIKMRKSLQLVN